VERLSGSIAGWGASYRSAEFSQPNEIDRICRHHRISRKGRAMRLGEANGITDDR
jgi:hypothetical protein